MRVCAAALAILLLCGSSLASSKPGPAPDAKSVTVPAAIDHNRVIINADVPLPDGSSQRIRVWIDNGNPDLEMSRHLAALMGLSISCDGQTCFGHAGSKALEILIGGMKIVLPSDKEIQVPAGDDSPIAPGIKAEINLPSTVLRHYDVLIDFPAHKFSIGPPGTIHFLGSSSKVLLNGENGLIQVPSKIENKKYNLALDLGSSISFLTQERFDLLAAAHPDWPHMTGAVGPANLWGLDDEPKWKLMRLDRVQYGPLFLTDVAVVDFPKDRADFFSKSAGIPTAGLLGANVFLNYRVGLDYAQSTVYFDIGRLFNFPDFDVVGLILRPEDDGRFTILGVADLDSKPSLPSGPDGVLAGDHLFAVDNIAILGASMGQVWSMLEGTPGQERELTVERGGRQFTVAATVQHFLPEVPDESEGKKKKK